MSIKEKANVSEELNDDAPNVIENQSQIAPISNDGVIKSDNPADTSTGIDELDDDDYYDFEVLSEVTTFGIENKNQTKRIAWTKGHEFDNHCPNKMLGGIIKVSQTPYSSEEIVLLLDGGEHSELKPQNARCNIIAIQIDGKRISFKKEIEHSHEVGFITQKERLLKNGEIPDMRGKYVGVLVVEQSGKVKVPNVNNDTPVLRDAKRFIVYLDVDPLNVETGIPRNNWSKVFVAYDYGQLDIPPIFEPFDLQDSKEYMYLDHQSVEFEWNRAVFRTLNEFGEVDIQKAEKEMKLIFTEDPDPRNIPPLVNVVPIINVTSKGQLVEIDASKSVDPDGDSTLLQYNIELIAGITTPIITKVNPNGSKIRFTFPADRMARSQMQPAYLFRVTVTDEKGDFRSVKVRVFDMIDYNPTPVNPIAKLVAPSQVNANTAVILDASGSSNFDTLQIVQTGGQNVSLQDIGNNRRQFTTPQAAQNYALTFQTIAKKVDKTSTANATINVTVTPNPTQAVAKLELPSTATPKQQGVIADASQSIADTVEIKETTSEGITLEDIGNFKRRFNIPDKNNFSIGLQAIAKKGTSQSVVQKSIQVSGGGTPTGEVDQFGIQWLVGKGGQHLIKQSRDEATDDRWSGNVKGLRNGFEATMYAKGTGLKVNDAHFAMKQFSGNHSGSGTQNNAWYDTGFRDTGQLQLQTEFPHPNNHDFELPDTQCFIRDLGFKLEGRWLGLKWSCMTLKENGTRADGGVRCRMWVDRSGMDANGKPQNKWELVYDFIDTGQVIPKEKAIPDEQDCEVRRSDTKEHEIYGGGLHVRQLGFIPSGVAADTFNALNLEGVDLHIKDAAPKDSTCPACKPMKAIPIEEAKPEEFEIIRAVSKGFQKKKK